MICGWISPEGKVYSCAYMEHLDLAYELCAQIQIPCGTVPDEELVKYGWIKAYFSIFDPKVHLYSNDRITEAQKAVLREDFENHPEDWDKLGVYELEWLDVIEPIYDEHGLRIPREGY